MIKNQPHSSSDKMLKLVWKGLFGSLFFYAFALFQLSQNFEEKPVDQIVLIVITSAAIISLIGSLFLPRYLLNQALQEFRKKRTDFNLSQAPIEELAMILTTPLIIRLALLESVALYGFGLSFILNDLLYFSIFSGVSMVGFLLNYPSEEKIRGYFKNISTFL